MGSQDTALQLAAGCMSHSCDPASTTTKAKMPALGQVVFKNKDNSMDGKEDEKKNEQDK